MQVHRMQSADEDDLSKNRNALECSMIARLINFLYTVVLNVLSLLEDNQRAGPTAHSGQLDPIARASARIPTARR